MELSLVITAHDEGLLAHKTMLSVFQSLKQIPDKKYEIIVHIDNGSPETEAYFKRYKSDSRIRIYRNSFGDTGAARNYCVTQARGKYLFFTDGDDLLSENYLPLMLSALESAHNDIVVHPEYNISFWDERHLVWRTIEPRSHDEAAFLLFSHNQWPSACGARREIFLKHPYILTEKGFGHEDYSLNIALATAGVEHKIVKNTITFYRQKPQSRLRLNDANRATQPYSNLFDIKKWQNLEINVSPEKEKVSFRQLLRKGYIAARDNRTLNTFITPLANVAHKLTGKKLIRADLSNSVMTQWKKIAKIETGLYPSPGALRGLEYYNPNACSQVNFAYRKLCQQAKGYADYIFIVPWLIPGGADKVVINYLKALREVRPEWRIAVVTTLPSKNGWKDQIPGNAFLLDFGNIAARLDSSNKELLFTRLITQLKAKKLHIVNSLYGYQWVNLYQNFVKSNYELFISLFCHDIIPGTNGEGYFDYADPYAIRIYPLVKKIYTDNAAVIDRLVKLNAFDASKFKIHYQPAEPSTPMDTNKSQHSRPLRILWASRVAVQKNPELMLRIAKKLNPSIAHIDAFGRKDRECAQFSFPKTLSTVSYKGPYNGFQSLNLQDYDILLYTSRIDGLPNVILEAAVAGLPIIASSAGGIGDFIKNGKTGFLVEDPDNEDEYIKIIQEIAADPSKLAPIAKNARQLIKKRHSWANFVKTIRGDFK